MTEQTKLLPDGQFVVFTEPGNNVTVGRAEIKIPITIYSPRHFDTYREDAKLVLKLLKGEATDEEVELLRANTNYTAVGCETFLAALAYEILDGENS